jgi:hypothetical protein
MGTAAPVAASALCLVGAHRIPDRQAQESTELAGADARRGCQAAASLDQPRQARLRALHSWHQPGYAHSPGLPHERPGVRIHCTTGLHPLIFQSMDPAILEATL